MVGHGHAEPDGLIYFAYLFLQSDARRGRLPKISGLRAKMSNKKMAFRYEGWLWGAPNAPMTRQRRSNFIWNLAGPNTFHMEI
jgi:hypothetical protein